MKYFGFDYSSSKMTRVETGQCGVLRRPTSFTFKQRGLPLFRVLVLVSILGAMQVQTQTPVTFLFGTLNYLYNTANNVANVRTPGTETYVWADTTLGRVRGTKQVSRIGKSFYQFRGIPYAKAPLGDLRFEPPVPHEGWEGVHDATSFGHQCWQMSVVTRQLMGDEDCLFINIASRQAYTKDELPQSDEGLHPVIVFIHGGLFMSGGANIYRPKYMLDENVVLVTLNYRLASFGFLNTMDGAVTGNMGLKDQVAALEWVQDNIKFFNGDPKRVTILGESAGSVSVHLHTLSPMSRGLFASAISQSGTALSPWGLIENPQVQTRELAEGVDCPTDDSERMVKCLKALPAMKIARYHVGYIKALAEEKHSLFGPTVESNHNGSIFLPARPLELMQKGKISKTPWIAGVNSGEGLVHLIAILRNDTMRKILNNNWEHFAPVLLNFPSFSNKTNLAAEVKRYYLNNAPISQSNAKEAANMVSDRNFFLDNHDAAILQSRVAPTYIYYYTYQGLFALGNLLFSRTPLPLPGNLDYLVGTGLNWVSSNLLRRRRKSKLGICHSDEIPLLFNVPLIRREINQNDVDYEFSRKLINLWISFAETGVPDTRRADEHVTWNTVRATNPDLLDIPLKRLQLDNNFAVIDEPFHKRILFWKNHSVSYL